MFAILKRGYTGQLKQKGQMSGTLLSIIEGALKTFWLDMKLKKKTPNLSISKVRIKPSLQFVTYIVNCNTLPVKYLGHLDFSRVRFNSKHMKGRFACTDALQRVVDFFRRFEI